MRVPDGFLQFVYLRNLNNAKDSIAHIQEQITTQNKINRPSDSPLGNARIMRLKQQIKSNESFANNISNSISMLDNSTLSMEGMQTEVQNVLLALTKMNNATVNDDLSPFVADIDAALNSIMDLANSKYNNQYSFSGTNSTTKPFSFNADKTAVVINGDLGGDQKIRLSNNILQKINITGKELFLPVMAQSGNLDSGTAVGGVQSSTSKVYDADGNEYDMTVNYTKTAANTYDLSYEIKDSDSNIVSSQTVNDLVFDTTSGKLKSMDGSNPKDIKIEVQDKKINLVLDVNSMTEKSSASKFVNSLSQKADIFNTLLSIKEKLLNGEKPNAVQSQIVEDFNQHVLNKLSEAGSISNRLSSSADLLQNRKFELLSLLSSENDVDMAKALVDLQSAQYSLDTSYKISSIILPRSLLDYM